MPNVASTLKQKLRKLLSQLPWLSRGLVLAWQSSRRWTIAWLVLLVLEGVVPVGLVYLTKLLVDALVAATRNGANWPQVRTVLIVVAALAGFTLLGEVMRKAVGWIRTVQAELVQDHINDLIHTQSIAADLAFYEFPDYYDHLHRARSEATFRPVALLENVGTLLQNSVTLLAMGAVLVLLGPWLAAALFVSVIPALWVVVHFNVINYKWRQRITEDERRAYYYDSLLTQGESASELRLFALGDHFRSTYRALRTRLRNERAALVRRESIAELGAGILAMAITGAALTWIVWRAAKGLVTLGELALIYGAFNQGQRLLRSLLENVGQLYSNSLFLGNLFEFLSLEPKVIEPPAAQAREVKDLQREIRFDRVTFRYPESERNALDNFSLKIRAGQIAAIVGPNGAGKSTLIKLLCRFYDPESGRIDIDGVDLRQIETQSLRRLITVLFQEPVHYNMSVRENVEFGDLQNNSTTSDVQAALAAAGAREIVERLPHGYRSLLGR
jgi:ATP-binding cassette subfamily B protein